MNDDDERARDGDYRKDDEKPQIVQLSANDLSKEEVELELAKAKEGKSLSSQRKSLVSHDTENVPNNRILFMR